MDDTTPDAVDPPVLGAPAGAVAGRSGGSWVAVRMAVANLLGYSLNLVASRLLGPIGFGALGALLGVVLIGNVAALGLQTVAARVLAGTAGRSEPSRHGCTDSLSSAQAGRRPDPRLGTGARRTCCT